MATYYDIFGQKVQYLSSDPSNVVEGQVWYNETDNVAKYEIPNVLTSWRTGGSLNTARGLFAGSSTSQTAAIAFGGSPPDRALTEDWNGPSWTEVADLNTARQTRGTGTYLQL